MLTASELAHSFLRNYFMDSTVQQTTKLKNIILVECTSTLKLIK